MTVGAVTSFAPATVLMTAIAGIALEAEGEFYQALFFQKGCYINFPGLFALGTTHRHYTVVLEVYLLHNLKFFPLALRIKKPVLLCLPKFLSILFGEAVH